MAVTKTQISIEMLYRAKDRRARIVSLTAQFLAGERPVSAAMEHKAMALLSMFAMNHIGLVQFGFDGKAKQVLIAPGDAAELIRFTENCAENVDWFNERANVKR